MHILEVKTDKRYQTIGLALNFAYVETSKLPFINILNS